jgi:hypothetical protein
MVAKPQYVYSGLQARHEPAVVSDQGCKRTRLITLLPGTFQDDIALDLRLFDLNADTHIEYEALSYVWGSEEDPVTIKIGRRWSLRISQNLDGALRHLRSEVKPRVLWVDAVCINQGDLQERAQQVTLMADIYRQASQTVVWLGPEENESTHALDFLDQLGRQVTVDWLMGIQRPAFGTEMSRMWHKDQSLFMSSLLRERAALLALIQRPWFERVWIRQEIFLSSRAIVKCGKREISWTIMKNAVFLLYEKDVHFCVTERDREEERVFNDRLSLIRGLGRERPYHLLAAIANAVGSKCKDPKDRVFGVLDILDKSGTHLCILPDYTLSVAEVYTNLVQHLIDHHKSLAFLSYAERHIRDNFVSELPSWVPDWRTCQVRSQYGFVNAGGYLAPLATVTDSLTLRVSGVMISRIAEVFTPDGIVDTDRFRAIKKSFPSSQRSLRAYGGRRALVEAYCRVLYAENFNERIFLSTDRLTVTEASQTLSDILEGYTEGQGHVSNAQQRLLDGSDLAIGMTCVSEEGRIGWVPRLAAVGDLFCVLPGCPVMVVLRAGEGDAGRYSVIGSAFLDGMMNSEALLGPLPDHYVAVWEMYLDEGYAPAFLDTDEGYVPAFVDTRTGRFQFEDPRLRQFGTEWEALGGLSFDEANSRLRMVTPHMLQDRGVRLEQFDLV